MRKIHVLTRKEEVEPQRLTHCTVVIIDVLLATTTIAATLHHGAKEVIPVLNQQEAIKVKEQFADGTYILCGEKGGYTLEGFRNPDPIGLLKANLTNKSIILSTTNGTVAIQKCFGAKNIYTSSLLNGEAVANRIKKEQDDRSVLIVCAGSDNRFSMEDFLGAGYLISGLITENAELWQLTDSAKAALQLYKCQSRHIVEALAHSETGHLLAKLEYSEAIVYAAQPGMLPVVPRWVNHRLLDANQVNC